MNTPVWKVGDRVTLKDGDGRIAVVNSSGPGAVCFSYLDDPDELDYYYHPDDLVAAPEEKRCCKTCGHSRPLVTDEGLREIYTDLLCGAPLPLCVNSTSPVAPATSGCPVWKPATEEKRCCETCGYSSALVEGKLYECQAPLPDCVDSLRLMLAHMGEKCPVWRPRA